MGVLRLEFNGDWRGVFGMVTVVNDTQSKARYEVLGADFHFIDEI